MQNCKRKKMIWAVLAAVLLTGCKSDAAVNPSPTEGVLDLSGLRETDKLDGDPWCNGFTEVAETGRGLYFLESAHIDAGGNFLCYYDYESQRAIRVCNRPDCSHSDETCNAYFVENFPKEFYELDNLKWYDNAIYLPFVESGKRVLYRVSADGSSREEVTELFDTEINPVVDGGITSTSYSYMDICIHRGYVYFIMDKGGAEGLCRKKLEGNSPVETIIPANVMRTTVYRMEPYGKYLFFQKGRYNEDETELESSIYAYDVETQELLEVKENVLSTYVIKDAVLYYAVAGEGIYVYSLKDGKEELAVGIEENCFFLQKTDYGYIISTAVDTRVFDDDGNLLLTMEGLPDYMNSERLVYRESDESAQGYYRMANISEPDPTKWEWQDVRCELTDGK